MRPPRLVQEPPLVLLFLLLAKMPFQNCNFIKQSDHRPCEHQVLNMPGHPMHRDHCGMHAPIAARLPPVVPGQCEHIIGGPAPVWGHWCGRANAENERLCPRHVLVRDAEAAVAARVRAIRAQMQDQAHAQRLAQIAAEIAQPLPGAHRDPFLAHLEAMGPAPGPAPGPLGRIAADRQNVHTAAVVKQTNAGEAKLLAEPGDGKQVGLRIARVFAARLGHLPTLLRVLNDIDHWYHQHNCRQPGDRLYGKVIEGLYHTIMRQPEPVQKELFNRLWEEASESVGMCCEGHLSRLVNVMAGFDDTFKPSVSLGEALQSKMAALAASGAADAVEQAKAYMTQLGLPEAEQAPWLEALA